MKNFLQPDDRDALYARIDRVQAEDRAKWGHMTANAMICHLLDHARVALGDIPVADHSTFLSRHLLKSIVLLGFPAPKGKVSTFPEIDPALGHGTPPTNIEQDVATLKETFARFIATDLTPQPHTLFGPLTKQQWGRLIFMHSDYHLRQFGR